MDNNENNVTNQTPVEPVVETPVQPVEQPQVEIPVQQPVAETPVEPVQQPVAETPVAPVVEPTPVAPETVAEAPAVEIPVSEPVQTQTPDPIMPEPANEPGPIMQPKQAVPIMDTTPSTEPTTEEPKKEKKSKAPIIIIIIVVLMVLGLAGYVLYDHFNTKEEPAPKEEKITVTKQEAEKYLEYVPFPPEYDLDENGKTTDTYGQNAYSGKDITTNKMNEELLLSMAYQEVIVKATTPEKVKSELCGEAGTCYGDAYATIEDMNKQVKKMYDLNNIVSKEFMQKGGTVIKTDKYWAQFMGKGNLNSLEKVSKMVSYKLDDNNNLIIIEKAAFAISDKVDADAGELYKFSNKSDLITTGQDPEAMFKENEAKLATFKHTFKLDENNNFYYYSTQVQ